MAPAQQGKAPQTAAKGKSTRGRAARAAEARAAATRRRRLGLALTAMGVAIVIVVAFIASSSSKAKAGVTTTSGFDLPAVSGSRRIRLADFKGKPTVVNFFASWCSACDAELPSFAAVSGGLRDRVNFVGVASLETGDPLYMPHRHHLDWPLARDVGGGNGSGLHDALCGCNSMPVTAFYDAEGRLVRVDRQALVGPALAGELQRLFNITT